MSFQRTAAAAGLKLGGPKRAVVVAGADPILASRFQLGLIAGTALADFGCAAADLADAAGAKTGRVESSATDGARHLVSFALQRLNGRGVARSNEGNPFVDSYKTADDRWIFIHGGFEHLARGLAEVIGVGEDASAEELARAIGEWNGAELEATVARQRLCATLVRTPGEWRAHPQGQVLAALPVVRTMPGSGKRRTWEPHPVRPLAGLRVLDLTRVLAGPTCGKYLASLGADVLHVRAPQLPSVESFVLDTGLGKRQAWCDFTDANSLARLREVAQQADVIVSGYRPGVFQQYGLDRASLRAAGWGGVHCAISCYGPEGPFCHRAGWEQLAQAASGMQLLEGSYERPKLSPAAATDYTTGILMAGAICRALLNVSPADIDASLCQTAGWILKRGAVCDPESAQGLGDPELANSVTEFGTLAHLDPGVRVEGVDIGWNRPSRPLGSGSLRW